MTPDEVSVAEYELLRGLGDQRHENDRHSVEYIDQRYVEEIDARRLLAQGARIGEESAQDERVPEEGNQKEHRLDCCDVWRGISHQEEDGPHHPLCDRVVAQFARPAVEEFKVRRCCSIVAHQTDRGVNCCRSRTGIMRVLVVVCTEICSKHFHS